MTTLESRLRVIEQVDFKGYFTDEELKTYRGMFIKYDANKTAKLELFELHQMYEDLKEPKTNAQLRELIKEADPQAVDGIDYKSFLTILLKDKKGQTKSALGKIFVELLKPVEAKVHKGGGLANTSNMFEKAAADQTNSNIDQENIKRQQAAKSEEAKRKREEAQRRKIAEEQMRKEEEENKRKEEERKKKVAANLAKLKQNING